MIKPGNEIKSALSVRISAPTETPRFFIGNEKNFRSKTPYLQIHDETIFLTRIPDKPASAVMPEVSAYTEFAFLDKKIDLSDSLKLHV